MSDDGVLEVLLGIFMQLLDLSIPSTDMGEDELFCAGFLGYLGCLSCCHMGVRPRFLLKSLFKCTFTDKYICIFGKNFCILARNCINDERNLFSRDNVGHFIRRNLLVAEDH